MKNKLPIVALIGLTAAACPPLWGRVNLLEPWSVGLDASIGSDPWSRGATMRVGNGARGTDMTELMFSLTHPVGERWEMGGALGFGTLDFEGVRDDSGLTDVTLGAKYRFSDAVIPGPAKAVAEVGVSLPTGDPDHGLGAGGFGLFANTGLTFPVQKVRGFAQVGMKLYSERRDTQWGNVLTYSAGGMYSVNSEWMVSADVRVSAHAKDKINGVKMPDAVQEAYLASGGVWRPAVGPLEAHASLLLGLTGDAYDFGLLGGIRF